MWDRSGIKEVHVSGERGETSSGWRHQVNQRVQATETQCKKKSDAEIIAEISESMDKAPVSQQEAELDLQQIGEETGHKPVSAPAPKPERPMPLTLKGKDVYYGSREIWTKLFKQFNLTAGKLVVGFIEFEETNDPTIVTAKLVLAKAE